MKRLGGILALLVLAGCGYQWGYLRPEGIRSVFVEVFGNDTYRRGLELDLTQSITQEVMNQTGLLLERRESADALLEGTIVDVYDQLLLRGGEGQAAESRVVVVVEATLKDRRSGKPLLTARVQDRAEFFIDNDQNRATATVQALDRLARRLVLTLAAGLSNKAPERPKKQASRDG